ncbi:MAG: type II toxin-antitoxin system RelE/ParE family toxin [Bacteroidia bacterium]|nr:type II toxin-antitoxin system RelE/ParE family toxin [Bacteroidia bacterium]
MALKVFWTDFAKSELRNIFDYYSENASKTIARKIVLKIVNETKILTNHPHIGQVEELLINRKEQFRYIVCDNYKIIYWINKDKNRIEIMMYLIVVKIQ